MQEDVQRKLDVLKEQMQALAADNQKLRSELENSKFNDPPEELVAAAESRMYGNCVLPPSIEGLFRRDSLFNRKEIHQIYDLLGKYPEPSGGWLKPQLMDPHMVSEEYKNNEDKALQDAQKFILQTTRLNVATEFILLDDRLDLQQKIDAIKTMRVLAVRIRTAKNT